MNNHHKAEMYKHLAVIQNKVIEGLIDPVFAIDEILTCLLKGLACQHGFVTSSENHSGKEQLLAGSNVAWNSESLEYYKREGKGRPDFFSIAQQLHKLEKSQKPLKVKLNNENDQHSEPAVFLGIPLIYKGRYYGVLGLVDFQDRLTTEPYSFLEPFVTALAVLISKTQNTEPLPHENVNEQLQEATDEKYKGLGVWLLNLKGIVFKPSASFYELLEAEQGDYKLKAKKWLRVVPQDERGMVEGEIRKVIQTGHKNTFKHHVLSREGKSKTVETTCALIKNENRELEYLLGISREIGKEELDFNRKRKLDKFLIGFSQSKELRKGQIDNFLDRLLETACQALDLERANIWEFNEAYDQIKCIKSIDKVNPDLQVKGRILKVEDCPDYFHALLHERSLEVQDVKIDHRTKGFLRYFNKYGIKSLLDSQIWRKGKVFGVLCLEKVDKKKSWSMIEQSFAASLTEFVCIAYSTLAKQQAEEALTESENKYRRLFEDNPISLILYNNKTLEILDVNKAAIKEYGYSAEEFTKVGFLNIFSQEEIEGSNEDLNTKRWGTKWIGIKKHRRKDGSLFYGDIISYQFMMEGKTLTLAHVENVTQQVEARIKNENLIEQLKDFAFLSAHKLRGPLARILGLTSIFNYEDICDPMNAVVVNKLKDQSEELDEVIKKMVRITESSGLR